MSDFEVLNGVANFECCARCSAAIKNVFWHRGKPYGADCIEAITGNREDFWIKQYINGKIEIDEEATALREKNREAVNIRNAEVFKQQLAMAAKAKIESQSPSPKGEGLSRETRGQLID